MSGLLKFLLFFCGDSDEKSDVTDATDSADEEEKGNTETERQE